MINPQSLDLSTLPSVPLSDRKSLPTQTGIYFAIDSLGNIQYIGKAGGKSGIKGRWVGHHNQRNLESLGGVRIAYMLCPEDLLQDIETALIQWFQPPLNGGKVRYAESKGIVVVRQVRVSVPDLEKRIKDLREASGKSAQSLATEAGISTAYWYQIEKCDRQYITEEVLRGIERALGSDLGVTFND